MGKEIRKRRVVVTGLGLITPLGTGVEKTWNALCAGKSGIRRITKFDPSAHACQIAGEVTDFDPADYFEKKEIKKMDTFIITPSPRARWRWMMQIGRASCRERV